MLRTLLRRTIAEALPHHHPRGTRHYVISNKGNHVERLNRYRQHRHVPDMDMDKSLQLPHFVFAGETNVGKSSVINHLLKTKNLARASSAQAKTRDVHRFLINDAVIFVDTPGIPGADEQFLKQWNKEFLPNIHASLPPCHRGCVFFIHDSMRQTTVDEIEYFHHICAMTNLPPILLLSKDDKIISHEQRVRRAARIREAFEMPEHVPHVHYSVRSQMPSSRSGRRAVLRFIEAVTNAEHDEDCWSLAQWRQRAQSAV